jgi:major membrane immunogen (membrane-anchored lipoprotein)
MKKSVLRIIFALICGVVLTSCGKDANKIEGSYVGTYAIANLTNGSSWSITSTIEFKDGKYTYKVFSHFLSFDSGSGNFTIKDNKIIFELTNYDVEDAPIGIIEDYLLKGEYEYTLDKDNLTLSKTSTAYDEKYKYELEFKRNN